MTSVRSIHGRVGREGAGYAGRLCRIEGERGPGASGGIPWPRVLVIRGLLVAGTAGLFVLPGLWYRGPRMVTR